MSSVSRRSALKTLAAVPLAASASAEAQTSTTKTCGIRSKSRKRASIRFS